jgi:hypothetical protein
MDEPASPRAREGRRSLLPILSILRARVASSTPPEVKQAATRAWEIAPSVTEMVRPAYFLPGQLERVTGWTFSNEHPRREMLAGYAATHAATRAFLLHDVWLLDGSLYCGTARSFLHPRAGRLPRLQADVEMDGVAIYCTPNGNKYFGSWLLDDCVTYPLAAAEAVPVTTNQAVSLHLAAYERWLGMKPTRVGSAFFRSLVVFEDIGQNKSKHARFVGLGEALRARVSWAPHPGVFILRGEAGERRVLRNELEIAERLRDRRGLRIVDPSKLAVPEIVAACAGAAVVVGVEGSALMHGIVVQLPGSAVLTLQPPGRFVTVYKHVTDRDGKHFGFVVGLPDGNDFRIDPEEVERTLDLFPPVEN